MCFCKTVAANRPNEQMFDGGRLEAQQVHLIVDWLLEFELNLLRFAHQVSTLANLWLVGKNRLSES